MDHSIAIAERWRDGDLDLAVATCSAFTGDAVGTWDVELLWVAGIDSEPDPAQPLDIIVYSEPCLWRRRMQEALVEIGRDYQVTLTSQSIAAIRAGVENGLGVGLMTAECVRPETMRVLQPSAGVPQPLIVQYGLYASGRPSAAAGVAMGLLARSLRAPVSSASA